MVTVFAIGSTGKLLWSVEDLPYEYVEGAVVDSKGNLVVVAKPDTSGTVQVTQFNATTGKVQYSNNISAFGATPTYFGGVAGTPSGLFLLLREGSSSTYQLECLDPLTGKGTWSEPVKTVDSKITFMLLYSIKALPNGNAVIEGVEQVNTQEQVVSLKGYNVVNGDSLFNLELGDEAPSYVSSPDGFAVDSLGSIFLNAYLANPLNTSGQYTFCKFSESGEEVWETNYALNPSVNAFVPNNILGDGLGGAYFTYETPQAGLPALAHFSSDGKLQWSQVISLYEYAYPFQPDSAGDAIAFGAPLGIQDMTTYAASSGAVKSTTSLGLTGTATNSWVGATCVDSSNNSYTLGAEGSGCAVTKYTPAGTQIWQKLIDVVPNSAYSMSPVSMQWLPSGYIVTTDQTQFQSININKISASSGATSWTAKVELSNTRRAVLKTLEDNAGNVYVVLGTVFNPYLYTFNMEMLKLSSSTGAQVWDYVDTGASATDGGVVASTGEAYLVGLTYGGGGLAIDGITVGGAKSFQKTIGYNVALGGAKAAVDPSGNLYIVAGYENGIVYQFVSPTGTVVKTSLIPYKNNNDEIQPQSLAFVQGINVAYPNRVILEAIVNSTNYGPGVFCINTTSGSVEWVHSFASPSYAYFQTTPVTVDHFGNVLMELNEDALEGGYPSHSVFLKLNGLTGAARWGYSYTGSYFNDAFALTGVAVGPDLGPVYVGSTGSIYSATEPWGLMFKFEDTNAPICYQGYFEVPASGTLNETAGVLYFVEDGAGGTVKLVKGPADASAFTLNANGSFTYTVEPGVSGVTDSFTYSVTTAFGTTDGTAYLVIPKG